MLMVESRVAVDFERTADFAGNSSIVKLSDSQGGMDICRLLTCGFTHGCATEIVGITNKKKWQKQY
ncbi:hypothetical protein C5S39_14135 [Candidatus Methanophagaceae archaeon]|nr:hypothetical protein C5S39_14135 [Methanophagales archaeon]